MRLLRRGTHWPTTREAVPGGTPPGVRAMRRLQRMTRPVHGLAVTRTASKCLDVCSNFKRFRAAVRGHLPRRALAEAAPGRLSMQPRGRPRPSAVVQRACFGNAPAVARLDRISVIFGLKSAACLRPLHNNTGHRCGAVRHCAGRVAAKAGSDVAFERNRPRHPRSRLQSIRNVLRSASSGFPSTPHLMTRTEEFRTGALAICRCRPRSGETIRSRIDGAAGSLLPQAQGRPAWNSLMLPFMPPIDAFFHA